MKAMILLALKSSAHHFQLHPHLALYPEGDSLPSMMRKTLCLDTMPDMARLAKANASDSFGFVGMESQNSPKDEI
jgi:hypothetical protein